MHGVAELAFRCFSFDQDARPAMTEVTKDLESNIHCHDEENDGYYNANSYLDVCIELEMRMLPILSPKSDQHPSFISQSSTSRNSIA